MMGPVLAYLLFATILLHVGAALYHALIRRDGVFRAMAGIGPGISNLGVKPKGADFGTVVTGDPACIPPCGDDGRGRVGAPASKRIAGMRRSGWPHVARDAAPRLP